MKEEIDQNHFLKLTNSVRRNFNKNKKKRNTNKKGKKKKKEKIYARLKWKGQFFNVCHSDRLNGKETNKLSMRD